MRYLRNHVTYQGFLGIAEFKKKKIPFTTFAFFLPLLRILSKYLNFAEILYYICSWQHDNLWSLSLLPLMKAKKELDSPSAPLYGRHWGCPKWIRCIMKIFCPWSPNCNWLMERWIKWWSTKPMGTWVLEHGEVLLKTILVSLLLLRL